MKIRINLKSLSMYHAILENRLTASPPANISRINNWIKFVVSFIRPSSAAIDTRVPRRISS
jgi:hypothetical protein